MIRDNVVNILGTFAILALSFLFLARAAAPAPAKTRTSAPESHGIKPAGAVVIQALPADAIIIEALPAND